MNFALLICPQLLGSSMAQLFYVPKVYNQEADTLEDLEIPLTEARRMVTMIFRSINTEDLAIYYEGAQCNLSFYLFSYLINAGDPDQEAADKQGSKTSAVHFLYSSSCKRLFSLSPSGFIEVTRNYSNFLHMLRLSGANLLREVYRFTPVAKVVIDDKLQVKSATLCAYECSTLAMIQIPDKLQDPVTYIVSLDPYFVYYRLVFSCQLDEGRGDEDTAASDSSSSSYNLVQHKTVADILMNGVIMSLLLSSLQTPLQKHTFITLQYVSVEGDQHDVLFHSAPDHVLVHTMSDTIIEQHQICSSSAFNNRSPTLICPSSLLPRGVVNTAQARLINSLRNAGCIGNPWLYRFLSLLSLKL
ncbi:Hypothetical protein DHA2_13274 [Giardia duodenalis]|uniref:Uncharacterized protein n=1 Tax=Giardia intestinalis TaxID=5741 RepID=V6TDR6_GIAIN|nr:Hypothetical protein DHA2_13274 [Giardia intestinalis]